MKKWLNNPLTVALALFALLIVTGMALMQSGLVTLTPSDAQSLEDQMMPYRIGFYLLVIAGWRPISYLVTQPGRWVDLPEHEISQRHAELHKALFGKRWVIAAFFVIFEAVLVQRVI